MVSDFPTFLPTAGTKSKILLFIMALQISAQENFGELGVVVKFCSRVGWIGGVTGESRGREVAHYRDAAGAHCAVCTHQAWESRRLHQTWSRYMRHTMILWNCTLHNRLGCYWCAPVHPPVCTKPPPSKLGKVVPT